MKLELKTKVQFIALIAIYFISFIIFVIWNFTHFDIKIDAPFIGFYLTPFIIALAGVGLYYKIEHKVFIPFIWILPLIFGYLYLSYNEYKGKYKSGWDYLEYIGIPLYIYFYMIIFLIVYVVVKCIMYLIRRRN